MQRKGITSAQAEHRCAHLQGTELFRLRDGSRVTIRPTTRHDEQALRAFLAELSPVTRRLRFFSAAVDTTRAAHAAARADSLHYGLIAHDEAGKPVGHAIFAQLDACRAEVAVEVADHLHDRGLGTILIETLAAAAEERGIGRFIAHVLPENRAMLDVFRDGFDAEVRLEDGAELVEFSTSAWRRARDRFGADSGQRRPRGRSLAA